MRLTNFKQIRYGKDDEELDENARKDIIYRVFLGDRQVWEKAEDEIEDLSANNKIVTTWNIVDDFNLANTTEVTAITGEIDWGDYSSEDWRSGNGGYFHQYVTEGNYNITLNCKNSLTNSSIGQIKEINHYSLGAPTNTLIGVTLSLVPFSEHLLNDDTKGVFEDRTTIVTVKIPKGIIRIPQRLFYNTSFEELNFPEQNDTLTIGNYALVSNELKKVYSYNNDLVIGTKGLGYNTDGTFMTDVDYYCNENSSLYNYVINLTALERIHPLPES